jgi:hypothetical protein
MRRHIIFLLLILTVGTVRAQENFFGKLIPKPIDVSNQQYLSFWIAQDSGDEFIFVPWDISVPTFTFCEFEFVVGLRHFNGNQDDFRDYVDSSTADIIIGTCFLKDVSTCLQAGEFLKEEAFSFYGRYTDSASGIEATSYIWKSNKYNLAIESDLIENTVTVIYISSDSP